MHLSVTILAKFRALLNILILNQTCCKHGESYNAEENSFFHLLTSSCNKKIPDPTCGITLGIVAVTKYETAASEPTMSFCMKPAPTEPILSSAF